MALAVPERILITVRTYPNPSTQYRETVCTGGITDDGDWRRIYPVPLRALSPAQQFRIWDVISLKLEPGRDGRAESRRPRLPTLSVDRHLDKWASRYEWVRSDKRFGSPAEMVDAGRSLGSVRVASVKDLTAVKHSSEWDAKRQAKLNQMMLYDESLPLEKIPYRFRLVWVDGDGGEHDSLVIAWEMCQTWRNYRHSYEDEIAVMRDKFIGDLFDVSRREVDFFMGNDSQHRDVFMVCGWFIPPLKEIGGGSLFATDG